MNDRREGVAGLGAADEAWLDAALHEALTGETPPDLRLRILRASPEQAAAAAAHVDAARAASPSRPWWAAAAVLFGALVVGGVFALQRFGGAVDTPVAVAQEPSRELDVADAKQLAAHLARTTTVALTALQGIDGARLPNEPEYSAIVNDVTLLPDLRAALAADAAGRALVPDRALPGLGRQGGAAESGAHDGRRDARVCYAQCWFVCLSCVFVLSLV